MSNSCGSLIKFKRSTEPYYYEQTNATKEKITKATIPIRVLEGSLIKKCYISRACQILNQK